jgi:ribosome biogenesis protein UTP30
LIRNSGLKHGILPESPEICLITKDPQREYKDLVAEKELKAISKVVGVSKLKAKFKPYEAKRQLCASFDLFLTDDRVMAVLPRLLGKSFFEKKKLPIPITLKKDTISSELESVLNSTVVYFTRGTCQ